MTSFEIFNKDKKFEFFSETTEKKWNGPFYFVQGADIQFGFISRELDKDSVITWEKEKVLAENIVERINKMNPKPRFFAMCGDLCDAMPETELELRKKQEIDFKRIFSKLDKSIPLINICGNHDVGNTPTPETVQMYRSSFGSDYYSFLCGGVLFLVINSQYFADSSKVQLLAEEHSNWIDKQLEQAKKEKMRVVVFQHIPWFLKTIDDDTSYFTLKKELRKKWLDKFKQAGVEAIFCGHYHRNAGGVYNGMDLVVTTAVGGQLGNDKSGARVVRVMEKKIEHTYYETKDLPLNVKADEKITDETVAELESLKGILSKMKGGTESGDEILISKSKSSSFSSINGQKSAHEEIKNEVNENGKILAKVSQKMDFLKNKGEEPKSAVKTEIDIPSKGIHQVIKNKENLEIIPEKKEESNADFKRARNGIEKINNFSEIKYSPHDMAEYIFWTGDEKGVALTIEEFLQEGLMTRQEAITFLQSIKYNLDLMQSRYQGSKKPDEKISGKGYPNVKRKFQSRLVVEEPEESHYDEQQESGKLVRVDLLNEKLGPHEVELMEKNLKQSAFIDQTNVGKGDSNGQDYAKEGNKSYSKLQSNLKSLDGEIVNDEDYNEIMERVKVAKLLQKEYSLEEVIFELAKIMFAESLTKGNTEAQKAMQRFSDFLQNQVKHNLISQNLQKKIIDILSSALMDALSEHPKLLNKEMEEQIILDQNSSTSDALQQLLMLGATRLPGLSNSKEELSEKILLEPKKLFKGLK